MNHKIPKGSTPRSPCVMNLQRHACVFSQQPCHPAARCTGSGSCVDRMEKSFFFFSAYAGLNSQVRSLGDVWLYSPNVSVNL